MKGRIAGFFIGLVTLTAGGNHAVPAVHAAAQSPTTSASTGKRDELPASEATSTATLRASPRHGEWINVMDRLLITRTYIVHAPQGGRSALVLVIPDDRGLSRWPSSSRGGRRAVCSAAARRRGAGARERR